MAVSLPRWLHLNTSTNPGAETTSAKMRRWVRRVLGGLWILDGLLQLQPAMFSMAMLHNVMQPLVQGQPGWLSALINWSVAVMTPHVAAWNLGIVVIQLAIGLLLLAERRPGWMRAGLILSIVWSAVVWVFGEGLGGILTGGASILTGAPGSVLLYGWLAVLLLWDDRAWQFGRGFNAVRDSIAVLWGLAALQQLAPVYWTAMGDSAQLQSNLMMQPGWLAGTIGWAVRLSFHQPVLVNLILVLAMAYVAWGLYGPRPQMGAYVVALTLLVAIWWLGEGFGDIFTGMSTDLNTAPLMALMMVPGWMAFRAERRAAAPEPAAPTKESPSIAS
jgi:hypothetical protein